MSTFTLWHLLLSADLCSIVKFEKKGEKYLHVGCRILDNVVPFSNDSFVSFPMCSEQDIIGHSSESNDIFNREAIFKS
jgi:hypothetical protein